MTKPIALCRVSDTEPLRSILPMLESAGYECVLPDRDIRNKLRDMKCGNVDEFSDMHRRWGAEMPPAYLKEIGERDLSRCALYVDVNGCHNGPKVWERWPHFKDKVLTYFINGGEPRNTPDKGDCQMPATPMMTSAQHYRSTLFCPNLHWNKEAFSCDDPPNPRGYWTNRELSHPSVVPLDGKDTTTLLVNDLAPTQQVLKEQNAAWACPHGCGPLIKAPWLDRVYVFYPAFTRYEEVKPRYEGPNYTEPVSFVHNSMGWGGAAWYPWAKPLGVKSYGGGNSPDGLVPHEQWSSILSRALCTVYLKSGGAVDYSILEPMAAGCPTTFHESYHHHTRMYDLLIPGETCLTWSTEKEMADVIQKLRDPVYNRKIGEAGRQRMREVTWNLQRDADGFKAFMKRMFP